MRRAVALELTDDRGVDPVELARTLSDIEVGNRWFGGMRPVLAEVSARRPARLLDVGCGSADIARALLAAARRKGLRLEIVALDRSPTALAVAAERTPNEPAIRFLRADAPSLPFVDGAFDVVTCNLALHHFEPPEAVELLKEMRRVARDTPLVCDLRRSYAGYAAALVFAAIFGSNRLTRHDAPLSVRRAYTEKEALQLATRAGWRAPRTKRYPFFRMVLGDGSARQG